MILIFIIQLLITLSLSQIEANLQGNIWESSFQNCKNCTFRVSQSQEQFIYVNVKLQQENSEFHLVSQQLTAVSDMSQVFEQGSTIDLISALENRLTRFLKIEKPKFPLYISILDSTESSQFKISIQASSKIQCDNNCSQNGDCTEVGCICQNNFVGNNCNQKAQEIFEQEEQYYYIGKEPQYFYITIDPYLGQDIQLKLSTDGENGAVIYIQKSEANIIPKTDEYNINEDLVGQQIIFDPRPLKIDITVPDIIKQNSRFVFIAESLSGSYNTIPTLLKIELITDLNKNTTVSSLIIIIIVVSIAVAIILIIVIFCIFRNLKRRRLIQLAARQRQDIFYPKPNVQNEKIENFLYVDEKLINPDDQCSICLDNLVNGKELTQTNCLHYFHKECILAWVQKHQECPICRANLATKKI